MVNFNSTVLAGVGEAQSCTQTKANCAMHDVAIQPQAHRAAPKQKPTVPCMVLSSNLRPTELHPNKSQLCHAWCCHPTSDPQSCTQTKANCAMHGVVIQPQAHRAAPKQKPTVPCMMLPSSLRPTELHPNKSQLCHAWCCHPASGPQSCTQTKANCAMHGVVIQPQAHRAAPKQKSTVPCMVLPSSLRPTELHPNKSQLCHAWCCHPTSDPQSCTQTKANCAMHGVVIQPQTHRAAPKQKPTVPCMVLSSSLRPTELHPNKSQLCHA